MHWNFSLILTMVYFSTDFDQVKYNQITITIFFEAQILLCQVILSYGAFSNFCNLFFASLSFSRHFATVGLIMFFVSNHLSWFSFFTFEIYEIYIFNQKLKGHLSLLLNDFTIAEVFCLQKRSKIVFQIHKISEKKHKLECFFY